MLTAFAIERLKPKGKPYKVSDGNALYLLVKPTGAKLWRVRYHFGGKEQMLSLGAFPAVTLSSIVSQGTPPPPGGARITSYDS